MSIIPRHPDYTAREAHRNAIIAQARADFKANIDNSAAFAASSSDYYAYVHAWDWLAWGEILEDEASP